MGTHHFASKTVLLQSLQQALALHMQAMCSEQEVDLRQALLAYETTAQLAGLFPLPKHTLKVLRSLTTNPAEVQSELRALYIGIRRVATDNPTLEWANEQLMLCSMLANSIHLSKVNNCFNYLFAPMKWHQHQRRVLLEKSVLILPLALFGNTAETEQSLRRALRTDRKTPICNAYNRLTRGELSQTLTPANRLSTVP